MVKGFFKVFRYFYEKITNEVNAIVAAMIKRYSTPDRIFVAVMNTWFGRNSRNMSYKINKRTKVSTEPRYFVEDRKSGRKKYFNFRKQGIMQFSEGIYARGQRLGHAYLLDRVKFEEGDIVLDCGANTGDLMIFFENMGTDITYYAFEPGLIEYRCLELNISKGNLFNYALGDKDTTMTFYYKPEFGDSSLVEMDNYETQYTVNVKKLSTLIKELNLSKKPIKLVKIEAEGFEPEIIRGLDEKFENIQYISADLGPERGKEQESTIPEVLNYLLVRGFEICDVNVLRHSFLLRNTAFNANKFG